MSQEVITTATAIPTTTAASAASAATTSAVLTTIPSRLASLVDSDASFTHKTNTSSAHAPNELFLASSNFMSNSSSSNASSAPTTPRSSAFSPITAPLAATNGSLTPQRMRFGYRLLSELNTEWSEHYIRYNALKSLLNKTIDEKASAKNFIDLLEEDLSKVNNFYKDKAQELCNKFADLQEFAHSYITLSETDKLRRVDEFSKSVLELYVQLHLIQEYASLNYTGFVHILAKFDLKTKGMHGLQERYSERLSKANFNNSDDVNDVSKEVEKLYADVFEQGNRRKALLILTSHVMSDERTKPKEVPRSLLDKKGFIIDMDGVIYYQHHILPGVAEFIAWLKAEKKKFLFLTNSSERSPKELQQKLSRLGIEVGEHQFYNSSQSTAEFLSRQKPNGSAFVIGEAGLYAALYDVGYTMNEIDPDYVVIGETKNFNYERMQSAVNLVRRGAKLIGTNVDVYDKSLNGVNPGTACLVAPIELASGCKAYYLGKPNPLMLRSAMQKIGCDAKDAVIIGDRMDTDIIGGIESGIETVLVLSGVSTLEDLKRYAFRPDHVLGSVADIIRLSNVDE